MRRNDMDTATGTAEILPCTLTADELAARADDLAACVEEIDRLDRERAVAAKAARDVIDEAEERRRLLARIVRRKSEDRIVEVEHRHVHATCSVECVRLDSGEIVRSRPMTREEVVAARQTELPNISVEFKGTRRYKGP